jgi:hypothetical protein
MGEVHEGICNTYQSTHKIKWLLHRGGFYWPTMLNDSFRYYKGYESCQKFGDVQLAHAAILHPIINPCHLAVGLYTSLTKFILLHLKTINLF